jgi:cell fate regulator YaaT (PSP1 superfamily)
MPGSITPLPVMLEEDDRKIYDKLEPPKSIVVRYGYRKLIAELPYDGKDKPGCGTKLIIRTQRGMELGEMLTSTCPNSGCGHAVTRKQMLEYIDNSGGKNYPFTTRGKVMRVASLDDQNEQEHMNRRKPEIIKFTRRLMGEMDLAMRLVDIELLLGGERVIFYYKSEQWVDFRDLVNKLASEYQTRIEMQQVSDREEARLTADYEKCGQYCCCKQFLKVLKPVSMRSAKVQKATLDPTKISGRCGRLMCCLRYEDKTYDELRKRLPHRQTRVKTEDGLGTVVNSQILTQLVLVQLDDLPKTQAYAIEDIEVLTREKEQELREQAKRQQQERVDQARSTARGDRRDLKRDGAPPSKTDHPQRTPPKEQEDERQDKPASQGADANAQDQDGQSPARKRRRRRRGRGRRKGGGQDGNADGGDRPGNAPPGGSKPGGE